MLDPRNDKLPNPNFSVLKDSFQVVPFPIREGKITENFFN